jgi:hypothetical protein
MKLRSAAFTIIILAASLSLAACGDRGQAWKSPADAAAFAALEKKSLEARLPKERRAQLFFLWGQELSAQARSGQSSSSSAANGSTNASDPTEGAIAAFEKVVDMNSVLVDESRYNLELLWKDQAQSGGSTDQDKQSQQDKKNGKDQKNQQDKQNGNGQQSQQDKQNGKGQQGGQDTKKQQDKKAEQGKQDTAQAAEKDLSALVRDKEQSQDVESALKAEMERRTQDKDARAETGSAAPVEKDW